MKSAQVPENPLLLITDTVLPLVGDDGGTRLDDTSPRIEIKKTSPPTITKPVVTTSGLQYTPDAPIGKQFKQLSLEEEIELRFDELFL